MKISKGFSIIEVMAAVAIVAGLGGALFRLQLSSLSLSKQMVTRQLMAMYTDDLVSKMISQINFVSMQPGDNALTSMNLEAGSFGPHQNFYINKSAQTPECNKQLCNEGQLSSYYYNEWENHINNEIKLPDKDNSYHLTICRDYTLAVPNFEKDDPFAYKDNCTDGEFDPIVVKVSWADATESGEKNKLGRNDNYLVFRVPGR